MMDHSMTEKLNSFREITGCNNPETARSCLDDHSWNLDAAVLTFLSENPEVDTNRAANNNGLRSRTAVAAPSTPTASNNAYHDANPAATDGGSNDEFFVTNIVSKVGSSLLAPIRFFAGESNDIKPENAASIFINDFNKEYGEGHLPFLSTTFREALLESARSNKLLLVYLHSPEHEDTDAFCRDVLCNPAFVSEFGSRVSFWGGSIEHKDAYSATFSLQANTYPFLALLMNENSTATNVKLLERIEGELELEQVKSKINHACTQFENVINKKLVNAMEAQERKRLREEQDLALQQSMAEDQAKLEAKEKEQLAEQQRQAEALKQQQEQQQEEQRYKDEIGNKRQRLNPEPPAGCAEQTSNIRFQLPDGSRVQRRFLASATLLHLRDYVDVELADRESEIRNYILATNFPKREFKVESEETLTEAALVPQAVLYIQDLDA